MVKETIILSQEELDKIAYDDMGIYSCGAITTLYFMAPVEILPSYNAKKHEDCKSSEISITVRNDSDVILSCISPTNAEGTDYDWEDYNLSDSSKLALLAKAVCQLACYEGVKVC